MSSTRVIVGVAMLASLGAAVIAGQSRSAPGAKAPTTAASGRVERGRYLVNIMSCNDCHTPWKLGPGGPSWDMSRMLSGHPEDAKLPPAPLQAGPWWVMGTMSAWAGPWGTSFAANITPDSLTGIGIWTEDMFVKAMKTGRHMGVSRPILPPMPLPALQALTDEDLKSVYAYLRSIPPLRNQVPDPIPPATTQAGAPGR